MGTLSFTFIGDLYPQELRGKATAIMYILGAIGGIIGQTIASFVGPVYGFRWPFVIVSIPCLSLLPIYYFTTVDPTIGGKEREIQQASIRVHGKSEIDRDFYEEKMSVTKFKKLLSGKTFFLLLLNEIPIFIPLGVLYTFVQDFLTYNIGPLVGGIPTEQTIIVVLFYLLGIVIGSLLAGYIMDILWKRKYEYAIYFTVVATCFAAILGIGIFIPPAIGPAIAYAGLFFPVGLFASVPITVTRTVLINVTLPETRGVAMALISATIDIGYAIGPVIFSEFLNAVNGERSRSFIFCISFWFLSAVLILLSTCFLRKDLAENSRILNEVMKRKEEEEAKKKGQLTDVPKENEPDAGLATMHSFNVAGNSNQAGEERLTVDSVSTTSLPHRNPVIQPEPTDVNNISQDDLAVV